MKLDLYQKRVNKLIPHIYLYKGHWRVSRFNCKKVPPLNDSLAHKYAAWMNYQHHCLKRPLL